MTDQQCADHFVICWPLAKDHYLNAVDWSDPKSPWEQTFSGNAVGKADRVRRAKHKQAELESTASLFSLHTVRVAHSRRSRAKRHAVTATAPIRGPRQPLWCRAERQR